MQLHGGRVLGSRDLCQTPRMFPVSRASPTLHSITYTPQHYPHTQAHAFGQQLMNAGLKRNTWNFWTGKSKKFTTAQTPPTEGPSCRTVEIQWAVGVGESIVVRIELLNGISLTRRFEPFKERFESHFSIATDQIGDIQAVHLGP